MSKYIRAVVCLCIVCTYLFVFFFTSIFTVMFCSPYGEYVLPRIVPTYVFLQHNVNYSTYDTKEEVEEDTEM